MTIHITPEPEFSYVSFESNIASSNYGDLIARVIETFQPGKFVVTILANKVCLLISFGFTLQQSLARNIRQFTRQQRFRSVNMARWVEMRLVRCCQMLYVDIFDN